MLVLDANVAVAACAEPEGFADLGETEHRLRRGAERLGFVVTPAEL
jgi:hypothetical protein